jgi:simple sugar transport system ATP-binding protein
MITHKFREVSAYADDVSVLRRGRLIHTGAVADTTPQKLAEAMVGGGEAAAEVRQELADELAHDLSHPGPAAKAAVPTGPARLQIRGLKVMGDRGEPSVQAFDLEAHAGEIVGVAGVSGNGQRELMEALVGQRPRAAGTVMVSGEAYAARRAQNRRLKVRSLPEEPLRNACVGHLSVAQNMALRSFDDPDYSRGGWVRWGRLKARARAWIAEYGVKTRGEDAPIRTLSGGNVQRAVLARELGEPADLLLVANPVFGLDFAAVAEIHARLRAARDAGTAVLLVSEDLDELLALSDRIVVMSEGRIVFGCAAAGADRHTLGSHMGGHMDAHADAPAHAHPEQTP